MVDIYKNIGVNIETEILDSFPSESDTAEVRCEIYQRSTGYYYKSASSSFTSGQAYVTMSRIVGKTWRTTFTPNIAGLYVVNIYIKSDLRNVQYLTASGGVTSAGVSTGWNLSQLRSLLALATKDNSLTDNKTADADNLINMAIQDIGAEENGHWRYLEDDSTLTTTASQTTPYSLGSTVNEVLDMRIISPTEQKLIHYPGGWQNFVRNYPEHTDTGTPTWYIPYGIDASGNYQVSFYLWPSTAITVYYEFYKKIGTLTADSDVPEIPQIFQPVIVYRAAYLHAIMHKNDAMLAQLMFAEYDRGIMKMKEWNRNMADQSADIPRHSKIADIEGGQTSDSDYTAVSY